MTTFYMTGIMTFDCQKFIVRLFSLSADHICEQHDRTGTSSAAQENIDKNRRNPV